MPRRLFLSSLAAMRRPVGAAGATSRQPGRPAWLRRWLQWRRDPAHGQPASSAANSCPSCSCGHRVRVLVRTQELGELGSTSRSRSAISGPALDSPRVRGVDTVHPFGGHDPRPARRRLRDQRARHQPPASGWRSGRAHPACVLLCDGSHRLPAHAFLRLERRLQSTRRDRRCGRPLRASIGLPAGRPWIPCCSASPPAACAPVRWRALSADLGARRGPLRGASVNGSKPRMGDRARRAEVLSYDESSGGCSSDRRHRPRSTSRFAGPDRLRALELLGARRCSPPGMRPSSWRCDDDRAWHEGRRSLGVDRGGCMCCCPRGLYRGSITTCSPGIVQGPVARDVQAVATSRVGVLELLGGARRGGDWRDR